MEIKQIYLFQLKIKTAKLLLMVLESQKQTIGFENIEYEAGLSKVSIVGSGMVSNPGVAAQMFQVLADENIQIKMVSTSEIKVSAVVEEEKMT